MASESLLPEIIREILLKLPVESLLRCKSVCKEWYSLISDRHFIKSHYTLSSTNSINYQHHRLILNKSEYHQLSIGNYEIRNNLVSCPLYDVLFDGSINNAVQLENPLQQSQWFRIVGSCNGLLCISFDDNMFIYNPSTRICNELSPRRKKSRQELALWYSFGYDESTDDYKLVEMSTTKKVNIYSLKTGKWKKLGDFPYTWNGCGNFLNGALHWVAYEWLDSSCTWRIVSLDLAKETYGEVLLPVYADESDLDLSLGVLGEWLCVLCNYCESSVVDVWVMTVYGLKDSWTKLACIPCPTFSLWDQSLDPLCISNDGKVLLQFGLKLLVYDSKDSSSKMIDNSDVDGCHQACIVVESLVSPFPPLGLSDNNDDEN